MSDEHTPTAGLVRLVEPVAWSEKERAAIAEMMEAQNLSESALLRCALRQYQSDWIRRRAGETCVWSGDEQRAREFAGTAYIATPPKPSDEERDAARLDWLEQRPDRFANIDRITSVNGLFNGLPTIRAAIDEAMKESSHER